MPGRPPVAVKRKFVLLLVPLIVLGLGASALVWRSTREVPITGLFGGRLRPCEPRPNCVSSEAGTPAANQIAPFSFTGDPAAAWSRARAAIVAAGGEIQRDDGDYLWATFRTPFWRFVDDVELRLDVAAGVIHVRSGSRVGNSDLGTNRRRVEALRRLLAAPAA